MKILFICTGNICRSPAVASILRKLIAENSSTKEFVVDSAGTFGMYRSTPPEKEMVDVASVSGYKATKLSIKVTINDINSADLIISMDELNFNEIKGMIPKDQISQVHQFIEYIDDKNLKSIPDLYYGKKAKYEYVFKLIEKVMAEYYKRVWLNYNT